MRLLSKELLIEHGDKRPVATGFVTYVSTTRPVLMHCFGWEDYSDGYDDYAVETSEDNGHTWTAPRVHWTSTRVPEGKMRFAEPAAFFDPDHQQLIVLTDRSLHPKEKLDVDQTYSLVMDTYDPAGQTWSARQDVAFPGERSGAVSFSFPIKTRRGRILFPAMRQCLDDAGKPVHYRNCWATVDEMVTVIGEYDARGALTWRLGRPLSLDPEISSRGLNESALAELPDGRIAAVCRGDNSMFPEKPGYKWLSFSSDDGETWSDAEPLPATGGGPIESSASSSAFFRSIRTGTLYWIGNLCLGDQRPAGNSPRSSLYLVEVQEEPFALRRESIFTIDQAGPDDSPELQLSNFRFYVDRETGHLVLYMDRYCQRGHREWWKSDYYRYEAEVD